MQEMATNIYSSSIEEQEKVVRENFPCVECGKTYGTKASLRTHKYNQGQEVESGQLHLLYPLLETVTCVLLGWTWGQGVDFPQSLQR